MRLSPLTKRGVLVGVLLLLLVIIFTVGYSASESIISPKDVKICLTEDILINPVLQESDIWKIDSKAVYTDTQDLVDNDFLGEKNQSQSFEVLIKNVFQTTEDSTTTLTLVESPTLTKRPENLLVDIKSPREMTLLKATEEKVFVHQVKSGESLWDISRMYGINIETIIGANQHIKNIEKLKVGQELKILCEKGIIHRVSSYETLSDISRIYGIGVTEIKRYNSLKSSNLKVGQTLIIPGASPLKLEFRSGFSEDFIWPLSSYKRISSPFGKRGSGMHNGVDLAVATGNLVKAAKSGKVIFAGYASGYGYAVYIKHDDKTTTRYGHNSKLLVKTNGFVYQGETIALSGNTGTSTGPHVHFEIRINDKPQDPLKYLKK